MTIPKEGTAFVCSWSGGKDSCLALRRAMSAGARPQSLLTMLAEDGAQSRSHGLPASVLQAQAARLGIPLLTRAAPRKEYEAVFVAALQKLKEQGVEAGVFGDIELAEHREWVERVCEVVGIEAHLPLWQESRAKLLDEFLSLGFKATVVATRDEELGNDYLGRVLDVALVQEFERLGIDLCGERGEYHTVVTDGPIFSRPLGLKEGLITLRLGTWFVDVQVASM
jgi:uncharacterized protein (TIGR00290 family)